MKIVFLSLVVFIFSGCQAVHVTKQYYNEYVNPKAAIDYEDREEADIPTAFLDRYYSVDSRLVSLRNQIDMTESVADAQWFEALKVSYPWLKNIGFYDNEGMFVSGSEAFAYDSTIREMLVGPDTQAGTVLRHDYDRILMLNTVKTKLDTFRFVVLDLDFSALVEGLALDGLIIAIGDRVVAGEEAARIDAATFAAVSSDRDYSGSVSAGGGKYLWIRSHASDNLVYFFAK